MIDQSLKDKGFKVGDTITLSQSDEKLHIVGVSESAKYNASPVIFANDKTIEKINPALSSDKTNARVVKDSNWKDKNVDKDLEVIGIDDFVENLPGYKPQNLTMNFMITFLFVISATVIGVFLYVITCRKEFIRSTKSSRIYEWILNEDGVSTNLYISLNRYFDWLNIDITDKFSLT